MIEFEVLAFVKFKFLEYEIQSWLLMGIEGWLLMRFEGWLLMVVIIEVNFGRALMSLRSLHWFLLGLSNLLTMKWTISSCIPIH